MTKQTKNDSLSFNDYMTQNQILDEKQRVMTADWIPKQSHPTIGRRITDCIQQDPLSSKLCTTEAMGHNYIEIITTA